MKVTRIKGQQSTLDKYKVELQTITQDPTAIEADEWNTLTQVLRLRYANAKEGMGVLIYDEGAWNYKLWGAGEEEDNTLVFDAGSWDFQTWGE